MLLVQNFLKTKTLKDLEVEHGVYASISKNNRKISLNYDMIETKDSDELSWDCRGLILSKSDFSEFDLLSDGKLNKEVIIGDTAIVAFGFKRFFNYGQGSAAEINWHDSNLKIMNKEDGTLCLVHFDRHLNEWCMATRSCPEADLLMNNNKYTFRTLFEKALFDTIGISFGEYTSNLDKNITYCYELCTIYNVVVVAHKTCHVIMLGARDINSLKEFNIDDVNSFGVPKVKIYNLKTIKDILEYVASQNPMEHEGVVVLDSKFNRVKIKNPSYVILHRVIGSIGASPRNCLELILSEKDDDVITQLPIELQNDVLDMKEKYKKFVINQVNIFNKIKAESDAIGLDKKTFALTVQRHNPPMPQIMYLMNTGKINSVKDFVNQNKVDGTWSNPFLDKILASI